MANISDITWDGDTQDRDFSYILDQTTPVKACGGSPYSFGLCGKMGKDSNECQGPSSRVKRRRVLQFDDDVNFNLTSQIDDLAFLKSKEKIDEAISDSSQQGIGSQEASSFSGLDCLEDQVEDWLGSCFNYSQTNNPTTDICGTTDVLLDISEFMDPPPPKTASNPVQKQAVRSSRNAAFIGTKSYIQTQSTLTSFKIQPFTFIKSSMANGDMTLKEINRQIAKPPTIYETSAFSGKPVVNKTRIKTEGGEGSITIMRTKG
ncbi:hypothetical protein V2J09_003238 [Rumex salicifolius]